MMREGGRAMMVMAMMIMMSIHPSIIIIISVGWHQPQPRGGGMLCLCAVPWRCDEMMMMIMTDGDQHHG